MRKYAKYIIIVILFLLIILTTYFLTQAELHYWMLDKHGFNLFISIGSYVIKIGQTP